jgi:hypothetical protein
MKVSAKTYARLRAFVDVLQLKLDEVVDAVRPPELAAKQSPAHDAEDLIGEVHGPQEPR